MKFPTPTLVTTTCFLLMSFSSADTIMLKDGGQIEGTVVREDADNYVVEVQVSGTIRDEKIVPRGDVLRIEKEKADIKAFREIEGLFPAPELLTEEGYESRIAKFGEFLTSHPKSGKAAKVNGMLDALKGELAIIAEGGIKLGDEIVAAQDYEANAYEYDSRIAERRIKGSVARRDFLGALRKFDEYEECFGVSEGRDGLAALMMQVLSAYNTSIEDNLASLDGRLEKRKSGLELMSGEDKANTGRALEEQAEKIAARHAEEKASRIKWITPDSFHKESLEDAKRQIAAETIRLGTASVAPEVPLAQVYRTSMEELLGGTDEQKKAVIDEAKAMLLPEFYLLKLLESAGLAEK
jgi:DNA-binding Lrp family transcriptional regulator